MDSSVFLSNIIEQVKSIAPARIIGNVVRTEGTTISAVGFPAPIGAIARVERRDEEELLAEASKWELYHGGFSGRTAQQFIDYLLGRASGGI